MAKQKKDKPEEIKDEVITPENTEMTPIEQEESPEVEGPAQAGTVKWARLKRIFSSKQFKIAVPASIVGLILLFVFVQPFKFAVLNLVSSANVTVRVVDGDTSVPIEGATVQFADKQLATNKDGMAKVSGVDYGQQNFTVSKQNFTTSTQSLIVKSSNQDAGQVKITAEGVPVSIKVTNTLNGQVVPSFKADIATIYGSQYSAMSDKNGLAIVKIPKDKVGSGNLFITAEGFNKGTKEVDIKPGSNQLIERSLTPIGKHYFLSNRSGDIGVYSSNLDGTEQAKVVAGSERNDGTTEFSVSPDGKYAAYISKKDGQKNSKGEIMPALFSINLQTNAIKRVDEGAKYMYTVGWASNTTFLYTINHDDYQKKDNAKLKSVDVASAKLSTLHKNYSNPQYYHYSDDPNHVYYSTYSYENGTKEAFRSITVSSNSDKSIKTGGVNDVQKTKIGRLSFQITDKWYELTTSTQQSVASQEPTGSRKSFIPSPNGKKFAWREVRDRKGVILTSNNDGSGAKKVDTKMKVNKLYRWFNSDYVLVSIESGDDTSDYIVHIASGKATKIADVYALTYEYYDY